MEVVAAAGGTFLYVSISVRPPTPPTTTHIGRFDHLSKLRWWCRVITTGGTIDTFVKVKSDDIVVAIHRAQIVAWKKNKDQFPKLSPDDFHVFQISIHDADRLLLGNVCDTIKTKKRR